MSGHPHKWWILAAMTCSISMIFVDQTVLPVTLPTVHREIQVTELGLQWIVNSYLLVLASLVLAAGRMGDILGHRKIFLWGLAVFAIGSALCGMSYHGWWFISARVIQGIGGALLLPNSSAILLNSFPAKERGRAMGIYVGVGSIFLILGPLVGGVFTQYLSWRYVFWMNLPIGLVGTLLTRMSVPKQPGNPNEKFDFLGFFLLVVAATSFILGLMQGQDWGWESPLTLSLIILGILFFILLVFVEIRVKDPLIHFSLFRNRAFTGGVLCIVLGQSLIMVTVFWAIYYQTVLGFDPANAGYTALLCNFPMIIFAPLSGYIVDRFGPKIPVAAGFCLIAFSMAWFFFVPRPQTFAMLLPTILPIGCGMTMVMTPSFVTAMSEVHSRKRGVASGITTTVRQIGATFGMAVMGVVFLNIHMSDFQMNLNKNPITSTLQASNYEGLLNQIPQAEVAFNELDPAQQTYVKEFYTESYVKAFRWVNFISLIAALTGLMVALFCFRFGKLNSTEEVVHGSSE
ncbi:MAG: DHA2 family efflux MFS transporter permease subunit [Parachlamydiales bacterium]|nr:DHA2 family efflux MFS transporter permease subunit [Parachlamydiales bacterium]